MSYTAIDEDAWARVSRRAFQTQTEPRGLSGEQRLWKAVLEDGIGVVRGKPAASLQKRADACWFADDTRGPFGFVWLCEAFELEPDAVREAVRSQIGSPFTRAQRERIDGGMHRQKRAGIEKRWRG